MYFLIKILSTLYDKRIIVCHTKTMQTCLQAKQTLNGTSAQHLQCQQGPFMLKIISPLASRTLSLGRHQANLELACE